MVQQCTNVAMRIAVGTNNQRHMRLDLVEQDIRTIGDQYRSARVMQRFQGRDTGEVQVVGVRKTIVLTMMAVLDKVDVHAIEETSVIAAHTFGNDRASVHRRKVVPDDDIAGLIFVLVTRGVKHQKVQ